MISVVTPTLNRAPHLVDTIASVKRQTYRDFEHIVIDGGSTDGTVDMLRAQAETYRMHWVSEPDSGMYHAINKGLALSQGDIVCYLNSDDCYFPWSLELVAAAFARHPDADFVFGDMLSVDDVWGSRTPHVLGPFDPERLRRSGFLYQPAVFWRRRVLEEEGAFDETLRYVADCDYWMRLADRRSFRKVNEFLAVQREHAGTLRAADAGVALELARVRERYSADARAGGVRATAARLVRRLRVRATWSAFLAQALLPAPVRRGAWARTLNHGLGVSRRAALRLLLTPRWRGDASGVLRADRNWLHARLLGPERPGGIAR